jgi:hypothetical protein
MRISIGVNMISSSMRDKLIVFSVLVACTIFASWPMLLDGWFTSHDFFAHNYRFFAVLHEMRNGDFYPRWLSLALYGKGLPDLNFYSPAFYLWIAWLRMVGLTLTVALKLTCIVLFFVGALGIYQWLKKYTDTAGALISATLYLFIPYHFLDLYVRGALPEFAALALLPWLFHSIDLSFTNEERYRGVVGVSVFSAALILTHHLTTVMTIPFAAIYFGWHASTTRGARKMIFAALGPIIGAGLSAFYWLPAVTELRYLKYFKDPISVFDHFVYPHQWFNTVWNFGGSVPGPMDEMSFQIGTVLLCAVMLTTLVLPFMKKEITRFALLLLFLGLSGLFFTSEYSSFAFKIIYPFQLVQFPWRFLGLATLFFAAFCGFLTCALEGRRKPYRWLLLGVVVTGSLIFSIDQRTVASRSIVDVDESLEKYIKLGGSHVALEFLPKWANFDLNRELPPTPWVLPSHQKYENFEIKNSFISFDMNAYSPSYVVIPRFYFPGWNLTINDIPVNIQIDKTGFIAYSISAGNHHVRLWFGTTQSRVAGWAISLVSTLIILIFFLAKCKFSRTGGIVK